MAKITTVLIKTREQYSELGFSWVEDKDRMVYHEQVLCDAHMPLAIKIDGDYTPDLLKFLSHTTTELTSDKNKWNITYKILIKTSKKVEKINYRTIEEKESIGPDGNIGKSAVTEEYKEIVTELNSTWKDIKDLSELKINKNEIFIIDICGKRKAIFGVKQTDIIPKLEFSKLVTSTLSKYAWWNASWTYKKKVNLSNASSGYQIKLLIGSDTGEGSCNVDCNSHCNTDFSDLRFTNSAENAELDYWIQGYTVDGVATIWIETNGDTEFYMYYGNAAASTTSSGANTFQFFDDFPGSSLDSSKWDTTGSPGITVASGELSCNTNGTNNYIKIKTAYGKNYRIVSRLKDISSYCWQGIGFALTPASPYNSPVYAAKGAGGSAIGRTYWGDGSHSYQYGDVYSSIYTYHIWEVQRTSTNIISYCNSVSVANSSTYVPSGDIYPSIGCGSFSNGDQRGVYDWIFVAKRPDTLTTVSSFGVEESGGGGGTAHTKSLTSSLTISDLITRTSVWKRTVADTLSLSDLISKKPGKGFSESLSISDDFQYLRGLLLSETLTLSDAKAFTYGKNLSNTLSISDAIARTFGWKLSDSCAVSDAIATLKYINRNFSETLTISDDFKYLRGLDLSDSVSFSDSKSFTYGKNLSNTVTLNDLIRRQIGFIRTFSDTIAISDSCITSLYTAYFKTLSDTLALNDLIKTATAFNRSINENLTMTETFVKAFYKNISDTLTLKELILFFKTAAYLLSIYDTLALTSAMTILKNQTLSLSDTLAISDYIMAISSKDMEMLDSTGAILVYLRRPYWDNLDGSLGFNSIGFSFRSGNYTSYIEDINDERITFTGYESADDVLTRFNKIADIADNGTEITISLLGTEWDGTYVIDSFTYKPIGLDVFEYTLSLKLVR